MQPLRRCGIVAQLARLAAGVAQHAVQLPDAIDPAALRGAALHHDRDRKRRLFHARNYTRSAIIFREKPLMKKVIPISSGRLPAAVFGGGELVDTRARRMHDLRISVTDRCNFRCTYCMPKSVFDSSYQFLPQASLLSFEEISRLAGLFVAHGVEKLRLTGGEPLLRRHVERLVAQLSRLRTPANGPVDLTLTTNGSLLRRKAAALRDAGLG